MKKDKKAQAIIEFMMTYGWAILVIIVAIVLLVYFGFFKTDFDKQFSRCVDEEAQKVGKFYVGNEINAIKIHCCEKLGRTPITKFAGEFVSCMDYIEIDSNSDEVIEAKTNQTIQIITNESSYYDGTQTMYYGFWRCIEWANKTQINPVWLNNCCIDADISLTDKESEYYSSGKIDDVEIGFKLSKPSNNTAYYSNEICFEGNEEFESIQIGNQTINLTKCRQTEKYLITNETICIIKKLVNYGQYQE